MTDTSSEEALQEALANLSGAIEDSGAEVTHGPLPHVLGDEMQLVQLLQNLLEMPSSTKVPAPRAYTSPP